MKIKHALFFIAIGYFLDIFGAFQKFMHPSYPDSILMTPSIFKVLGIVILLYKLLTNPKAKEFLNW
jgi:hypothetical protein